MSNPPHKAGDTLNVDLAAAASGVLPAADGAANYVQAGSAYNLVNDVMVQNAAAGFWEAQ
jgi:hypothetical protein